MAIELADDKSTASHNENLTHIPPKRMPASYVVCRGASQVPEILIAEDDEAAHATVSKQIKAGLGAIPTVFIYKLHKVVEFVAESRSSTPEEFEASHFQTQRDNQNG